jgi:hypothetical protein
MGENRGAIRVLVRKPGGRRKLGRPRRRWGILLKWVLQKWDRGMDWMNLAQNRNRWLVLVNAVMNF